MGRRRGLLRRIHAEARYAAWAGRVLARPTVGFVVVVCVGAVIHHTFGQQPGHPPPTWSTSFFVSYCLMFLEHLEPTPAHPLAQLVHYGQPLLGLVLVSEGVLRLGLNLLDRNVNARTWVGIMAQTTQGHVILAGLGSVGFRVAEELLAMDVEVFAIERDEKGEFVDRARQLGVRVVIGDARAEDLLRSLNVDRARAVIAATDDDLANLEIAMDIREMRKDVPIVMRLFDQKLAAKVRATLGIEVSVSTSRLAAPLFASAALDPSVVGTHRVGETVLVVVEVRLGAGSALRGETTAEIGARGLTVVAARRSPEAPWELPPAPDRSFTEGEILQLLVPHRRVDEVHRLAAG